MKGDIFNEMRWGATLGDRRFRTITAIARHAGRGVHSVKTTLLEMEKRGEVESKRIGRKKFYRLRTSKAS